MRDKIGLLAVLAALSGCSDPPATKPVAQPVGPAHLTSDCPDIQISRAPSWSSDSREITYVSVDGVSIYSLVNQTSRPLSGERLSGTPSWSPVDTRIAVVVATGSCDFEDEECRPNWKLVMSSAQSQDLPVVLAEKLAGNITPLWSPDGKRILLTTDIGALVIVDSESGEKTVIYSPRPDVDEDHLNGQPVWMSNERVVFQTLSFHLHFVDIATGTVHIAPEEAKFFPISAQAGVLWGRHAGSIAVYRQGAIAQVSSITTNTFDGPNINGKFAGWNLHGLTLIDANTGRVEQTSDTPGDNNPVWSPDGRTIAFLRDRSDDGGYMLCFATPRP